MFNLKGKKKHNLDESKKKIEEGNLLYLKYNYKIEIESLSKTYDIYHPRYKEVYGEFYINVKHPLPFNYLFNINTDHSR